MKKAIYFFHKKIEKFGDKVYPVLWVHDELQCVVHKDHAQEVALMIKESIVEAGQYFNLNIPMDGTAKVGLNWLETH